MTDQSTNLTPEQTPEQTMPTKRKRTAGPKARTMSMRELQDQAEAESMADYLAFKEWQAQRQANPAPNLFHTDAARAELRGATPPAKAPAPQRQHVSDGPTIEVSDQYGPTIGLTTSGGKPFRLGLAKAQAVVAHYHTLLAFCEQFQHYQRPGKAKRQTATERAESAEAMVAKLAAAMAKLGIEL